MRLYQYTIYRTDGEKEVLTPRRKLKLSGDESIAQLACANVVKPVPKMYYPDGVNRRATAWCDEDGLLLKKRRNPFFKVFADPYFDENSFIVGDIVLEEVVR